MNIEVETDNLGAVTISFDGKPVLLDASLGVYGALCAAKEAIAAATEVPGKKAKVVAAPEPDAAA